MTQLSHHAARRCRTRCIPELALQAALQFGQERFVRGAVVHTLGWREIRDLAERGIDLSRFEGVEVVESHDGTIMTVYRNANARAMRDRALGVRGQGSRYRQARGRAVGVRRLGREPSATQQRSSVYERL
jgi:predicted nuclease with RNAse H fold